MTSADIEKAIVEAADASDMNLFQKNRIRRIMTTSMRPFAKRSITNRVTEALLAEDYLVVTPSGTEAAFDWASILKFIETLLPIILQLIALF